ncbi:MAG: ABC transporter permease subunit [Pirellulaceae bacterium]
MQQDTQTTRWSSIRLIYLREMRDQLRDRRTVFSIVILPMLLYPLLGMLAMNIGQLFSGQKAISVCLVGGEHLPDRPTLVVDGAINERLLSQNDSVQLSLLSESEVAPRDLRETARGWINSGVYDAVVLVPKDLDQMAVLYTVTSDRSTIAGDRMHRVLNRWRDAYVSDSLESEGIDPQILDPFSIEQIDIAPASSRQTAFWSKLLPFVMFVWAMTGAFYPAIDLVAGEKERGTLETLLCSPALRSEIVWGKLMAVTSFSILTALLNVISMQVTALMVLHQTGMGSDSGTGAVSGTGLVWLLIAADSAVGAVQFARIGDRGDGPQQ